MTPRRQLRGVFVFSLTPMLTPRLLRVSLEDLVQAPGRRGGRPELSALGSQLALRYIRSSASAASSAASIAFSRSV